MQRVKILDYLSLLWRNPLLLLGWQWDSQCQWRARIHAREREERVSKIDFLSDNNGNTYEGGFFSFQPTAHVRDLFL
jgi:hypothetical protein